MTGKALNGFIKSAILEEDLYKNEMNHKGEW